jgi:hypothetical protein
VRRLMDAMNIDSGPQGTVIEIVMTRHVQAERS